MIFVVKQCQKEIDSLPIEIREDLADAVTRLELGLSLSMPLSRPMPDIGKGVHELRLRDRSGNYRVFYFVKTKATVYLLHAMKKKTQTTPVQTISVVRNRLKEIFNQ
jgi:phage-related protein